MINTPKIGLALGSGGWRGLAHIGVIKSLVKHNYTISAIAGTSSGALIGGLFALLQDIDKVENFFNKLKRQDLLFAFFDPSAKLGIFGGTKALKLIRNHTGSVDIKDLPIPFAAIAADILSGDPEIIDSGDLAMAIRTSSSIPLVFEPIKIDGKILIDGGAVNPVPVSTVKKMGADIIIGVNTYDSMFTKHISAQQLSKLDLINRSYRLLLNQLAKYNLNQADIIITPKIENLANDPFSRFINNQQTIDQGEAAMDQQIQKLEALLQKSKTR